MSGAGRRGTAVVTGASAGIGRELARELAARGYDLLLTARSEGALRTLADQLMDRDGVTTHVLPCDLAAPEGPDQVAAGVHNLGLDVTFLANNAGFGQFGDYLGLDGDRERDQIMLNVMALTRLTRLLLPEMLSADEGRVLNVASTAAFFPGPLMTVYYASKAYVLSYSLGLAEELRGSGVTVTCLCPGPTTTEFQGRAGMDDSGLFRMQPVMASEDVAARGIEAALRGEKVHVVGAMNRVTAFSARLAPRGLAARVVKLIQAER